MRMVGIHSKNRYILNLINLFSEEWIMLDIAAQFYGFTTIPLYDTLGTDNIEHCLNNSGCYNIFASS